MKLGQSAHQLPICTLRIFFHKKHPFSTIFYIIYDTIMPQIFYFTSLFKSKKTLHYIMYLKFLLSFCLLNNVQFLEIFVWGAPSSSWSQLQKCSVPPPASRGGSQQLVHKSTKYFKFMTSLNTTFPFHCALNININKRNTALYLYIVINVIYYCYTFN